MREASEDGTIKIWDLRAPGYQRSYDCRCSVNSVVLHPNQAEFISGDQDGNVRVWDLTCNSCVHELNPEGEVPIRSVSVVSHEMSLSSLSSSLILFVITFVVGIVPVGRCLVCGGR